MQQRWLVLDECDAVAVAVHTCAVGELHTAAAIACTAADIAGIVHPYRAPLPAY